MRLILLLVLLFLLANIRAFSQSNFQKAYVITNQGDTLHGFIDNRGWENKNPATVLFKKSHSDSTRRLGVADIRQFNVYSIGKYQQHGTRLSLADVSIDNLSEVPDTTTVYKSVFLKVIQTGDNVSLYSYSDNIKNRFFISTVLSAPQELEFRMFLNNRRVVYRKNFIGQLLNIAQEYNLLTENLRKKVEKADYVEEDLLNIVSSINELDVVPVKKRSALKYLAGVRLNQNMLRYRGDHELVTGNRGEVFHESSYRPGLSLGLESANTAETQRFKFRFELVLSTASPEVYSNVVYPHQTYKETVVTRHSLQYLSISAQPNLIYSAYNAPKFKLYLGAGLGMSYYDYIKNTMTETTVLPTSERIFVATPPKLANWVTVAPLRTGVIVNKKMDFSLIYTATMQMTNHSLFDVATPSWSLAFTYICSKNKVKN